MPANTVNRIVAELVVDRMKNISNGLTISRSEESSNTSPWTESGSYALTGPSKVIATVTGQGTTVQFEYGETTVEHDFSLDSTFDLFDTGFTLEVEDVSELDLGNVYDMRMNNSVISFNQVRTWMDSSGDSIHPFIQVFPGGFNANNTEANNRRTKRTGFDIRVEVDFDDQATSTPMGMLMDIIGDFEDEIQRDNRLFDDNGVCYATDCFINEGNYYNARDESSVAGVYLFLEVKYRTKLNDSTQRA